MRVELGCACGATMVVECADRDPFARGEVGERVREWHHEHGQHVPAVREATTEATDA